MSKFKAFIHQFHWKIILIRILVNGAAMTLTTLIIPDIYYATPYFWNIFIISIGLGILNAIVKPTILLLTGQFIFATFGLLVILINTLILYLLEWIFPNILVVDSFFWALVTGVVLGLVSNALENLLGLTPPIVPDENIELRKRIEAEQPASLVTLVAKPQTKILHDIETQSVSEISSAKAVLDTIQVATVPDVVEKSGSEAVTETLNSTTPPLAASQMQGSDSLEPQLDEQPDDTAKGGAI